MPIKNPVNHQERLIQALFAAIREKGWKNLTVLDVVRHAKQKKEVVEKAIGKDKGDWLNALETYVTERVFLDLAGIEFSGDQPAHERLFDVFMARFDVMQDMREDVLPVFQDASKDSCLMVQALSRLPVTMDKMAMRAGVSSEGGARGQVKILGLCLLYLRVLSVWIGDDTLDLSKTMAALDQSLSVADRAMEWMAAA